MLDERLGVLRVLPQAFRDRLGRVVVAAAGQQPLLHLVVGDVEVDDGVEVQAGGLRERARVAVEHVAVAPLERGDDGAGHQLVGREMAGRHVRLDLAAELGIAGHLAAQDVARGDVLDPELAREPHALRALPAARWGEHENSHPVERTRE